MQKNRQRRVAELIRQEIAEILQRGVKDPRVGFCSVMHVKLSPDLHYADTYVSVLGSEKERRDTMVGLERSAGWIRREIGRRIRLRHTPEIRFRQDDTLDEVYRIEQVIEQIHQKEDSPNDETN